jgi:hypothetical protein
MDLFNKIKKPIVREFEIEVISIPIVYNKYGDHDPNGLLYVLRKDASKIKQKPWKISRKRYHSHMKK